MNLLHGAQTPPGEGMVVEIHLDIIEAPTAFLDRMQSLGFEDDPFLDFYPKDYKFHLTGRTRALQRDMHHVLPPILSLVDQILDEAQQSGVPMYIESEIVRDIHHFHGDEPRSLTAFDGLTFARNTQGAVAKADVHIEFQSGTVPDNVRAFLVSKHFYWVRTPASDRFPSEEIATLQPSIYADAHSLYQRLLTHPLPACTGVHLEQKLSMLPTGSSIPLPEVIDITH